MSTRNRQNKIYNCSSLYYYQIQLQEINKTDEIETFMFLLIMKTSSMQASDNSYRNIHYYYRYH